MFVCLIRLAKPTPATHTQCAVHARRASCASIWSPTAELWSLVPMSRNHALGVLLRLPRSSLPSCTQLSLPALGTPVATESTTPAHQTCIAACINGSTAAAGAGSAPAFAFFQECTTARDHQASGASGLSPEEPADGPSCSGRNAHGDGFAYTSLGYRERRNGTSSVGQRWQGTWQARTVW